MTSERKRQALLAVLIFGLAVGGCGVVPPPFVATPADLIGAWKPQSGSNLLSMISGKSAYYVVEYVEFRDGGLVTLHAKSSYKLVADFPAKYTVNGDNVMITSDTDAFAPITIRYGMSDADSLSMTDAQNQTTHYARASDVPADARCLPLYVVDTHSFDVIPHPETGLAYVNHQLWFSDAVQMNMGINADVYSIDPNEGMPTLAAMQPSEYRLIQTMQGDDRWCTCHCYDDAGLQQITPTPSRLIRWISKPT